MLQSLLDKPLKIVIGFYRKALFSRDPCFDFTFMRTDCLHSSPPLSFCVHRSHLLNWGFFRHCFKKGLLLRERRPSKRILAFGYVQIVLVVFFRIKIANNQVAIIASRKWQNCAVTIIGSANASYPHKNDF